MKDKELFIVLSVEECDEAYGKSLVQYQYGEDIVSFAFTNVDVSKKEFDVEEIQKELLGQLERDKEKPLWSVLSKTLLDEILESEFDMHYVEEDYGDWTKEKADEIYEEVKHFFLTDVIKRGEDDAYLTFDAGAMGKVNWKGHPYYGEPCLDTVILSPEKIQELQSRENMFVYVDSHGDRNYVEFYLDMYEDNDNLYLEMLAYEPKIDGMDHYGDVTVNTVVLPYLHATIDTNNNGAKLIPFLVENGFGEHTGKAICSGFCHFPIFKFSEEKLKEICPKEFLEYQKAHGRAQTLDEKMEHAEERKGQENRTSKRELER